MSKEKKKHKDYEHHLQTELLPCHYPRSGRLDKFDKRTKTYMILSTNYQAIIEDGGGDLSRVKLSLIERFVFVQQYLRQLERRIIKCKKRKLRARLMRQWGYHVNSLLGLSKKIGLDKRRCKVVNLESYITAESSESKKKKKSKKA